MQRWLCRWNTGVEVSQSIPSFSHTFSHFRLMIHPKLIKVDQKPNGVMEDDLGVWYKLADQKIGLAAPVKKVLEQVLQQNKELSHDAHGAMCEA